jgi:hypothetical protein
MDVVTDTTALIGCIQLYVCLASCVYLALAKTKAVEICIAASTPTKRVLRLN